MNAALAGMLDRYRPQTVADHENALREIAQELQQVRIRIDVDTDPPPLAEYEVLTLLAPIPFQVRLFTLPCLFAGKLHAILCRNWQERVKGRDFYDCPAGSR